MKKADNIWIGNGVKNGFDFPKKEKDSGSLRFSWLVPLKKWESCRMKIEYQEFAASYSFYALYLNLLRYQISIIIGYLGEKRAPFRYLVKTWLIP